MHKLKTVTAALATVLVVIAMLAAQPPEEKRVVASHLPPPAVNADAVAELQAAYIVREVDGIVYAFSADGAATPLYDIVPAVLREADAASLREGVPLYDAEALARFIEDYGS